MAKLPSVTGSEAIRAFGKAGFAVLRTAGSHHVMKKEGHPNVLSVPVHGHDPIKRGTLRSLIKAAAPSIEEFVALLS